jgi:Helix-turn-helix domain/RodZ C-terminal domain
MEGTVLEIGSNLREARDRRGLPLTQIDADTHIRTRYLQALEEERFDLLPGAAYVRGFLRTYADYLGLNADLFVAEYDARFAPPEDDLLDLASLRPIGQRRRRLPATIGVGLLVLCVAVVAWRLDSEGEPRKPGTAGSALLTQTRPTPTPPPLAASPPRIRQLRRATLVLTARRGPCWLLVRAGSSEGRHLHEGTLTKGRSLHLSGKRLWIRLGAPQNLDANLNGKPAALPADTANIVATSARIRTVERG